MKEKSAFFKAETILNALPQACCALDADATILYVNKEAESLFGRLKQDVLKKNIWELFPEFKNTSFYQFIEIHVLREKKSLKYECFFPSKGAWMLLSATAVESGCVFLLTRADSIQSEKNISKANRAQERTDLIASITETMPDIITVIQLPGGSTEYVNRDPLLNLGFSEEEIAWMYPEEKRNYLIHPDDLPSVHAFYKKLEVASRADIISVKYRCRKKDGNIFWLYVRGKILNCDEGERPCRALLVGQDITNQKNAEEKLIESRNLLQGIIDAPNVGIAVYKAVRSEVGIITDFVHEFINRRTLEVLGEDFTGKLLSDHGENGITQMSGFIETIESGVSNSYVKFAEIGGRPHWMLLSNAPLGRERLVHVSEDVTNLKQAENALKERENLLNGLLGATSSSIMLLKSCRNNEGRIVDFEYVYTNTQALRSVYREDLVGKYFLQEFPGSYSSRLFDKYVQVIDTGQDWNDEFHINFDGFDVWTQIYAKKLEDSCLITYNDITKNKKAEFKLKETSELMQSVFDTSLIQISVLKALRDENGVIVDFIIAFVNKELEKETGRTNLVGKLYSEEYSRVKDREIFDAMAKAVEDNEPVKLEYFYPYEDSGKWYSCMFIKADDGVVATNLDITERKKAEQELIDLNLLQQKEILNAIIQAQEEERERIGESLHNGVAQLLYGIQTRLDLLASEAYAQAQIQSILNIVKQAINDVR